MILLNEESINKHLTDFKIKHLIKLHILNSIDSTNLYLKNLPLGSMIDLCCAETQTKGRGRLEREWFSPFAENIYSSSRWNIKKNQLHLSTLSLIVGLAVIATLNTFKIENNLFVKWPNDIIWQGKKLCGILVELVPNINNQITAIIGIGLNVNSDSKNPIIQSKLDRPWCSLYEITGSNHDRNTLIANLILKLHQYMTQFMKSGFKDFRELWKKQDYLYGKFVTIKQPLGNISGLAHGVNDYGQLIIINEQGNPHLISSGEASLSF